MFHRHKKFFGIPLFKGRKIYIELWISPAKCSVDEHFHMTQSNIIIYIFGNVTLYKRSNLNIPEKEIKLNILNIFKYFLIERLEWHRFVNNSILPFIFINIAKFHFNYKPISASEDFHKI